MDGEARIIIDSREQRAYAFENSIRKALPAGDYSIEGLETRFVVERKSLDDWTSTIIHNRARFNVELEKLRSYDYAAIVIEGSISDILTGAYKSKVAPKALFAKTIGLIHTYYPIQILFAGDRPQAYELVSELLRQARKRWCN